jgi:hypothetical protein
LSRIEVWLVEEFYWIWLARRFLAVCSPGVHGRRVWWESGWTKKFESVGGRKEEIAKLQKNLMEFAPCLRKLGESWRSVRAGPREFGPPSHVYLWAFDSLQSVSLSFKHNHGK